LLVESWRDSPLWKMLDCLLVGRSLPFPDPLLRIDSPDPLLRIDSIESGFLRHGWNIRRSKEKYPTN